MACQVFAKHEGDVDACKDARDTNCTYGTRRGIFVGIQHVTKSLCLLPGSLWDCRSMTLPFENPVISCRRSHHIVAASGTSTVGASWCFGRHGCIIKMQSY
mmetsp:Transcript_38950/g.60693  ORF Transcript_38950/g.60693 Transcript_38950/m.60693 type:complete len:101 (-) Transcript_38950:1097-1399(-)